MTDRSIDYDRWYPEVPAVLDTNQLADLLHTNEQIIRAWSVWASSQLTANPAAARSHFSAVCSSTGSSGTDRSRNRAVNSYDGMPGGGLDAPLVVVIPRCMIRSSSEISWPLRWSRLAAADSGHRP